MLLIKIGTALRVFSGTAKSFRNHFLTLDSLILFCHQSVFLLCSLCHRTGFPKRWWELYLSDFLKLTWWWPWTSWSNLGHNHALSFCWRRNLVISGVLSVTVLKTRFPRVSVKSPQVLSMVQKSDLRTQAKDFSKRLVLRFSFFQLAMPFGYSYANHRFADRAGPLSENRSYKWFNNHFQDHFMFWTWKGKQSGIILRPLRFPLLYSAVRQCNICYVRVAWFWLGSS